MAKTEDKKTNARMQRIKDEVFPDVQVLDTDLGGFVPLPMVLRLAIPLMTPREWTVLTSVMMRLPQAHVTSFQLDELCYDLNYNHKGKLRGVLNRLGDLGFIVARKHRGREYFCVPDPVTVLTKIAAKSPGPIDGERLAAINDLLVTMGREPIAREVGNAGA